MLLAFNVGISDSIARAFAKEMDVKIARDSVIYRLEEELVGLIESCMPKERFTHFEVSEYVVYQYFLRFLHIYSNEYALRGIDNT